MRDIKEYNRLYYMNNREKIIEKQKQHYQEVSGYLRDKRQKKNPPELISRRIKADGEIEETWKVSDRGQRN